MGQMHKLFLLGSVLQEYTEKLREKGYKARAFSSPSSLLKNISGDEVLIIGSSDPNVRKDIAKHVRDVPKIIISSDAEGAKSASSWLKEPLAYSAFSPSVTELSALVAKVISESEKISKGEKAGAEFSLLRDEANFQESMSKVLVKSNKPSEIFSTFLRRAVKITNADGWAFFINDETSGELYCKKSPGMERACSPEGSSKQCLAREVTQIGKTLRISGGRKGKTRPTGITSPPGSYLGVPVSNEAETFGVLELYNKPGGRDFTNEDACMVEKFADLASHALEKIGLQQRLEELVITDDLTKLFNTRYLTRSLEAEIQRSIRYSTSVSLIFMDLDYFKDVNDVHGHLVGSKLLAEVGQFLLGQLRSLDIVARYGGDEFVIVLPQTELNGALVIADRMRENIEDSVFLQKEGLDLKITASFGVASFPETADSKEALIKMADDSMYNVKKNTRNGVYAII